MPTKIAWTDETWNPVTGCTPVDEGCRNCYAKRLAEGRLRGRFGYPEVDPFQVVLHSRKTIDQPYHWKKPRRIFVCSMGDLFHEDVPIGWNYNIFHVMARCPQHTFMILTKRPDRMKYFIDKTISEGLTWREGVTRRLPNNIWLGVSVEDQATASERIPILLDTPAAVRFVSIEPMLENIELDSLWHRCPKCDGCGETAPWDSTIVFNVKNVVETV